MSLINPYFGIPEIEHETLIEWVFSDVELLLIPLTALQNTDTISNILK